MIYTKNANIHTKMMGFVLKLMDLSPQPSRLVDRCRSWKRVRESHYPRALSMCQEPTEWDVESKA